MKLMTQELEKKFPKLYETENLKSSEIKVIAKYFHPLSIYTWYATEYDPEQKLFFGFVIGHDKELGYFSLEEMESIEVNGLKIERDLYWKECTLEDVMSLRKR